tara:strand:+ start:52 stop:339 length:288 start_codon:yes stop_codon:yes gene_type:complete
MNKHSLPSNLTEKEVIVIDQFINELYAEPGFSDVSPQDLAQSTKIPMKSLRGVLGSLTKKNIIYIEDKEYLGTTADIVYLNEEFYYLHPEWSQYC